LSAYFRRQIAQTLPVVFLITVACFCLIQLAPGGPAAAFNRNPYISPQQVNSWLAHWCLESNPDAIGIAREFGAWLGVWNCESGGLTSSHGWPNFLPGFVGGGDNGLLHGDLGYSLANGQPVLDLIRQRLPATLILMVSAWVIWVLLATSVGVVGAINPYSIFDRLATLTSYLLYSLPTFWLGLVLIYVLSVGLGWLPAQGIVDARIAPAPFATPEYWVALLANPLPQIGDIAKHLVLPATTVVAVHAAEDSRFVRGAMREVLSQDYIRTARAKGLRNHQVILKHALRNALLPLLTKLPLEVAFLFQGAVVAETIFSWPGIGLLFYQGVNDRDYFLLMGILLVGALLIVLANVAADGLYTIADPRVRMG
jgi:peptide/nickel transport system permease protein